MTYGLGIDVGTTFSAAAVCRADGSIELINLGGRAASMPSVVVARDDGVLLFGEAGESRARVDPTRVAREFKRRLGDPTPLVLGGTPYSAQTLTSLLIRYIFGEVVTRMNSRPSAVVVTHPASYSAYRRDALATAIAEAGVDRAVLVSEPEAAATEYSARSSVEIGDVVAVYDFGGGTFDVALLRRTDEEFLLLGAPVGVENLGGSDFDVAVFEHVNDMTGGLLDELDVTVSENLAALNRLRRDCRDAKESLSSDLDALIPVIVPGASTAVTLTRKDFQRLIYPRVPETFAALRRALDGAGVELSQVNRIVLVGGSSRIPLIRERVAAETGRPIAADIDPEHAVVLGAARRAHRLFRPAEIQSAPPSKASADMPVVRSSAVSPPLVAFAAPNPTAQHAQVPPVKLIAHDQSQPTPTSFAAPTVSAAAPSSAVLAADNRSPSRDAGRDRTRRSQLQVWGFLLLVAGTALSLASSATNVYDFDTFRNVSVSFGSDFSSDTFTSNVAFAVLMVVPILGAWLRRYASGFVLGATIGIGIGVLFEVEDQNSAFFTFSALWLALLIGGVAAWLLAAGLLFLSARVTETQIRADANMPLARSVAAVLAIVGSIGVLVFAGLHHVIVFESRLDNVRRIADEGYWRLFFVCSGLATLLAVSGAVKYQRLRWPASGLCAAEAAYMLQFTELFFRDGSHAKIVAVLAVAIAVLLASYPLSSFVDVRSVRRSTRLDLQHAT